jgi:SpoVK/Ycf46/Vps4 family AAA+-type ATPase
MTSKWVGEGEKLVRTLFRMAADVAPSIIFLDEMDSLLGRRRSDGGSGSGSGGGEQESSRRFKTEFMVQMDGISAGSGKEKDVQHKTLLIGCTNCPWDVDDAVMRRFQRRIYIPLPDPKARMTLWKNIIEKSDGSVRVNSRDLEKLVKLTQGFSCSDISSIANEAAFGPLRDFGSIDAIKEISVKDIRPIQMKDFENSIQNAKKSVSVDLLKRYKEWESAQAAVTA